MRFMGNGITSCYPDEVDNFISITVLKVLYETELRYHVGNVGLGFEERHGLWRLFSASRRMPPGELREQDRPAVWLWSDLHLGHAMTIMSTVTEN